MLAPPIVFDHFQPVSLSSLTELIAKMKPAGSPADPLTPRFLKEVFSINGKPVLAIINSSLSSGVVPQSLKHATVQPILKKHKQTQMCLAITAF